MKLKLLLIISAAIICAKTNAQTIRILPQNETTEIQQTSTSAYVSFRLPYIDIAREKSAEGTFNLISSPILTRTFGNGEPMLPRYNKILEFSKSGEYTFVITKKDSTIIDLNKTSNGYKISPAQKPTANSAKTTSKQLIINDNAYAIDELKRELQISLTPIGTMRNNYLVRLDIIPFDYNPTKNILVIYNSIDIKVYNKKSLTKSSQGEVIKSKSNTYLIISHPQFETSISKFAAWKTMQGYNVKIAYANQDFTNTNNDIKNYIQNFYENPPEGYAAPQYVLFAADETIIPSWEGRQVFQDIVMEKSQQTDLYYCEFTGDILPEIMYGRFSATDNTTMGNIVDKIIKYEKTDYTNFDFLNRMAFISGVDIDNAPYFSNTALKYIYNNYANPIGNTSLLYPYNETYGIMPCENSGAAQSIINQLNTGVGLVYYHGHGNPSSWDNPFITYDDINNLTENTFAGFWIANCCLTSKYHASNNFAEAVLRKKDGGAAGYIGAANETIWEYDFMWLIGNSAVNNISNNYADSKSGVADALYHTLTNEQDIDNQYFTAGQILNRGNLAVTESGCISYKYYWEVFNLMGDPSMVVHYKTPTPNNVEYYPQNLVIGNKMLTIETAPYALCALSQNGKLIASEYADKDGTAMLNFNAASLTEGEATLVITAQNKITYIEQIPVSNADNAIVGLSACRFSSYPKFNDATYISLDIKNLAQTIAEENNATNIDIEITTDNPSITIKKEMQPCALLAPQQTTTLENAFKLIFAKDYPQGKNAKFKVTITYNNDKEQRFIIGNIDVLTPMLECKYKSINDKGNALTINSSTTDTITLSFDQLFQYTVTTTPAANINNILEAGEQAELTYTITNTGKITIDSIAAILKCSHQGINISNKTIYIKHLGANVSADITFKISLNIKNIKAENINFALTLNYDNYSTEYTHQITANAQIEDFEHNGETPNKLSVNSRRPWVISTDNPYSGNYCFESASIPDQTNTYFKIEINNPKNDTITFYVRTSCEEYNASTDTYYDHLEFSVDGDIKQNWAGVTPWTEAKLPIPAGNHTLKWLYWKDGLGSENDDKVWVDKIVFPPCNYTDQNSIPTITAELPAWLFITDKGDGTATISGYSPNNNAATDVIITANHKNQTTQQKLYIITGKDPNNNESDFVRIYPTPATDFINIDIKGKLSYNKIRVFDTKGQKVFEQDLKSTKTQMYLTDFKSGIYILELKGDSGKMRRKIAVIK